jgi:hypothetical protein
MRRQAIAKLIARYCRSQRCILAIGFTLLSLLMVTRCKAQEPPRAMNLKFQAEIAENGNAHIYATITFSPPSYYDVIKTVYPDLYLLFRDLISNNHASWEVNRNTVKITGDDANQAIHMSGEVLGFSVCRDQRWEISLTKGENLVTQVGNKLYTTFSQVEANGVLATGTGTYILPSRASEVHFDAGNKLTYHIPLPRYSGKPQLQYNLIYHEQIMSCVYKIYADPSLEGGRYWVAKSVVTNTGNAPMYDVKIYYSLGEYADEWTPEPYSVILPGGSVVDCYYPLISSKVATFKTENPAHLTVRCIYKDAAGHEHEEDHTKLVTITGINQIVSSYLTAADRQQVNPVGAWMDMTNNMPLIATYVTKTDDPVKQLAGWISSTAGGVAATNSDKDALTWLKAAYDTEVANNIVYQTPSGFLDGTQFVQDIKFPRDTLMAKSGTCIDLAILYASLAEAVGLQAYLMVVPSHCFPVIKLPKSGQLIGVETTGLRGGDNAVGFADIVKLGTQEFVEHLKDGRYHLVDIDEKQGKEHITPPDLPPVGPDFLTKCGIQEVHYVAGGREENPPEQNPQQPNPNPPNVANPPELANPVNAKSYSGTWKGYCGNKALTMHMSDDNGVVSGDLNITLPDGELFQADFRNAHVKNGEIEIYARGTYNGHPVSVHMKGRREGGKVSGSITLIDRGPLDVPVGSHTFVWKMVCVDTGDSDGGK